MWIDRNYVTYAEVSLDVDLSSIVYTLNARNRVLSVWTASDAAAVSEAALRFKPIEEAVGLTLERLAEAGHMDGEDDCLLVGVSADDGKRREALAQQVESAIKQRYDPAPAYRVAQTDRATARAARENGMSPARYAAWQQSDPDAPPADYAKRPVRQLLTNAEVPTDVQPRPQQNGGPGQ